MVAASDSKDKVDVDYVCDGTDDQVEINAAIAALPAAGGSVVLREGTYTIAAAIAINRDDVMLVGSGHGTLIQVSANVNVIEVGDGTSARTNVIIKDLQVDGSAVTGIPDIHGIFFRGGAGNLITRSRVEGCYVHGNLNDGIHLHYSEDCMVVRNRVESVRRDGIRILRSNRNQVALNDCDDCERGIEVYILSEQNIIANNKCSSSDDGIEVHQGHHNIVVGNYCRGNAVYGIEVLDGSRYNLVIGNYCEDNGTGIEVREHSDQNIVIGNYCEDNGTGIAVSEVAPLHSNDNYVMGNYLWNNATTFTDTGTGTKLDTKIFQFQHGGDATGIIIGQFISADGSPKGWEIDAAGEWAIALGQLPLKLRRVVRIKIWAVSNVLEADHMRLEININAGASNEPYTTEAIAVANKPSETSNFAVNDVIYWEIDPSDDPDIGDLAGGDSLGIKVLHEAAGDGDIATDAVLRCVEIEYV